MCVCVCVCVCVYRSGGGVISACRHACVINENNIEFSQQLVCTD